MRKKLFLIGFACLLCVNGFTQNKGVICTLKALKTVIKQGETPEIDLTIQNKTDSTIYLIQSLDGSPDKMRYPHVYFTIELVGDTFYRTQSYDRCGNIGGISPKDFIKIPVDSAFEAFRYAHHYFSDVSIVDNANFNQKGIYKIQFHYSAEAQNFTDYAGLDTAIEYGFLGIPSVDAKREAEEPYREVYKEIISLLRKVPKVKFSSNVIFITVE